MKILKAVFLFIFVERKPKAMSAIPSANPTTKVFSERETPN